MNKKTISTTVFILLFIIAVCPIQILAQRQYAFDSIQIDDNKFRYGILPPLQVKNDKKYPLVIALHGAEFASELEADGMIPFSRLFGFSGSYFNFYLGGCWLDNKFHEKYPAYILMPHIHSGLNLTETETQLWWNAQETVEFLDLMIDQLVTSKQIDTNRIYITGHSMGGGGTLLLPPHLKIKPAALVPSAQAIGGVVNVLSATDAYKDLAVWYIDTDKSDDDDKFIPNLKQQDLCVNDFESAGMNYQNITHSAIQKKINNRHRFFHTEYYPPFPESGGHYVMKYVAQDTLVYNWMFQQHRIDEEAINITYLSADDYELNWSVKNPSDTVEIWFRDSTDWQLLTKDKFSQNQLTLTDYIEKEKLDKGHLKICCINSEGFAYGLDERKVNTSTTSISKQMSQTIKVYPNPATSHINIECNSLIKATIVNQSGACVVESNNTQIDISHLPAGLYIVNIETALGTTQHKLVKK